LTVSPETADASADFIVAFPANSFSPEFASSPFVVT